MDTLALLRHFGAMLEQGDGEGAVAIFAPDVRYDEPPKYALRGRDTMRAFIDDFLLRHRDVRFVIGRTIRDADSSRLALEWRWTYTRIADGEQVAFEGVSIIEVVDGLISSWRGFSAKM